MSTHWVHTVWRWASQVIESVNEAPEGNDAAERLTMDIFAGEGRIRPAVKSETGPVGACRGLSGPVGACRGNVHDFRIGGFRRNLCLSYFMVNSCHSMVNR